MALIREKHGEVLASDFYAIGVPSGRITQMCDEGILVRVGLGRYREADPNEPRPRPDEVRALRSPRRRRGEFRELAIALLREKGEMQTSELKAAGIVSPHITQLCDEGTLVRIGHGRYREGDSTLSKREREEAKAQSVAARMAEDSKPSLRERAVALVRERGMVRTADLTEIGIPRCYLAKMCQEGLLEKIGYGLYRASGRGVA